VKYFISVNGRPREIELIEFDGGIQARVDGEVLEVDFEEVDRLGQIALAVGSHSYAVSIDGEENSFSVTVAGRHFEVEIEDERERAAHAAEGPGARCAGPVKSVMPGIVMDLLVAEGEEVSEGQPLLILEAMKMQNEILAPSAGSVKRIHVREGEAVSSGAPLMTLS